MTVRYDSKAIFVSYLLFATSEVDVDERVRQIRRNGNVSTRGFYLLRAAQTFPVFVLSDTQGRKIYNILFSESRANRELFKTSVEMFSRNKVVRFSFLWGGPYRSAAAGVLPAPQTRLGAASDSGCSLSSDRTLYRCNAICVRGRSPNNAKSSAPPDAQISARGARTPSALYASFEESS
ncbi:hypothetical protein EVAR_52918_1 [Eumeta japonica]|uniref:Uncharacterized protein n=1 Tax=Eumeta variegata TaxID=151549 RepID=A0A4C1Y7K1_EUMVA|nr:hypothetical protein EVAR_52918_1 [Eumeta japonica]